MGLIHVLLFLHVLFFPLVDAESGYPGFAEGENGLSLFPLSCPDVSLSVTYDDYCTLP